MIRFLDHIRRRNWRAVEAEFRRAVEADGARQNWYGMRKQRPTVDHLAAAQLRAMAADETAEPRNRFGGLGPQSANLASVLAVAAQTNQ